MSEIFARSSRVFDTDLVSRISCLKIHWNDSCIVDGTPVDTSTTPPTPYDIPKGETWLVGANFADGNSNMRFVARHPIYEDIYYQLEVSATCPYVTTDGVYMVATNNPSIHVEFHVRAVTGSVDMIVFGSSLTAIINGDIADTVDYSHPIVVEPFNVIFDRVAPERIVVETHIADANTELVVSANLFTNTPLEVKDGLVYRPPIAHRFEVNGNALSIAGLPDITPPAERILSINGVAADHGGITIKFLE